MAKELEIVLPEICNFLKKKGGNVYEGSISQYPLLKKWHNEPYKIIARIVPAIIDWLYVEFSEEDKDILGASFVFELQEVLDLLTCEIAGIYSKGSKSNYTSGYCASKNSIKKLKQIKFSNNEEKWFGSKLDEYKKCLCDLEKIHMDMEKRSVIEYKISRLYVRLVDTDFRSKNEFIEFMEAIISDLNANNTKLKNTKFFKQNKETKSLKQYIEGS